MRRKEYLDKKINKYKPNNEIIKSKEKEYIDAVLYYEPFRRSYFRYFEDLFKINHEVYYLQAFNLYEIKKTKLNYKFRFILNYAKISCDGKNYRLDNCMATYKVTISKDLRVDSINKESLESNRHYNSNNSDKKHRHIIGDLISSQFIAQSPFITLENLENFISYKLQKVIKHLELKDLDNKDLKELYFKLEINKIKSSPLKLKSIIRKFKYNGYTELMKNNSLWYTNENDELFIKEIKIKSNINNIFKIYEELKGTTAIEELILSLGIEEFSEEDLSSIIRFYGDINIEFHFKLDLEDYIDANNNKFNVIEDLTSAVGKNRFGIYINIRKGIHPYLGIRYKIKGNPNNLNNPILGYYMGLPLRKINYDYEYWYRKAFKKNRKII